MSKCIIVGLPCDVLPKVDYTMENSSRDCILYYVCGYVTKQI